MSDVIAIGIIEAVVFLAIACAAFCVIAFIGWIACSLIKELWENTVTEIIVSWRDLRLRLQQWLTN